MPKVSERFDPTLYAPVADRLTLFWSTHPTGRIETRLVRRTARDVVFEARVYRNHDDREPAATGWAAEREGDGEINTVACLENTETSAIGRALANFGFTAARERPSAEEMAKAERVRARVARRDSTDSTAEQSRGTSRPTGRVLDTDLQQRAHAVSDLLRLVDVAERAGLRATRAARWREALLHQRPSLAQVGAWERRLRAWLRRTKADSVRVVQT